MKLNGKLGPIPLYIIVRQLKYGSDESILICRVIKKMWDFSLTKPTKRKKLEKEKEYALSLPSHDLNPDVPVHILPFTTLQDN